MKKLTKVCGGVNFNIILHEASYVSGFTMLIWHTDHPLDPLCINSSCVHSLSCYNFVGETGKLQMQFPVICTFTVLNWPLDEQSENFKKSL